MQNLTPSAAGVAKKKWLLVCVALLIVLVGAGVVGAAYIKKQGAQPNQVSDNIQVLQAIGKLMIVLNEQPIIATINQAAVLVREQPFYVGAQDGDKLVIFPKLQKAVIYSPGRNIIVNSGPFTINSGKSAPAPVSPQR